MFSACHISLRPFFAGIAYFIQKGWKERREISGIGHNLRKG